MNTTAAVVHRWVAALATAVLTVGLLVSLPASAGVFAASRTTATSVTSPDAVSATGEISTARSKVSTCKEARQAAKKAKQRHRKANRAHAKAQNRATTLVKKLKKARKSGKKAKAKKLQKQLKKHRAGKLTKTRKARAKARKARDRAKKNARELCADTPTPAPTPTPTPSGVCAEQTSIPATECAVLMDFKAAATPEGLPTWGVGDPCTWIGVHCDEGHVWLLGFASGHQLESLPGSVDGLTHLTGLILANNHLTTVPDSLGNLTHLAGLDLRTNQLTTLPDSLGNLGNLTHLAVDNNRLTTLPDSIGNLTQLTSLTAAYNQLAAIPPSVGSLTHLTHLYLDNNKLSGDVSPWAKPMSLRDMQLTLRLAGNGCLHTGGDVALAAWMDQWVWAGGWRTGCA